MMKLIRNTIPYLISSTFGALVFLLMEKLAGSIYSNPDCTNMPATAYMILLAGSIIASYLGGLVITRMTGEKMMIPSLIIGTIVLLVGVLDGIFTPGQPVWFIIGNIVLCIPCAYLGFISVRKKSKKQK